MIKRFRALIEGKVQGVFYRANAREKDTALGLKGFVKNLANGSVELQAEGEDQNLQDLIHWCEHGPPGSRVDRVQVEWLSPIGTDPSFLIQ